MSERRKVERKRPEGDEEMKTNRFIDANGVVYCVPGRTINSSSKQQKKQRQLERKYWEQQREIESLRAHEEAALKEKQ